MTLIHIVALALLSIPFMFFVPAQWRPWGILLGSVLAVGWFLNDGGFTSADALVLTLTLALVVAVWWAIQPSGMLTASDWAALSLIAGGGFIVLMLSGVLSLGTMVSVGALSAVALVSVPRILDDTRQRIVGWLIAVIILCLIAIKIPAVANFLGFAFNWDATTLTTASPFVWLGFSYVAFRMIAVLRDHQAGRLPESGFALRDMAAYILFFPAFTAGPIDRAGRFIPEFTDAQPLDARRLVEGVTRISVGVFKKFVIADTLALMAMNPTLIDQTTETTGLWLLLYMYSFQIFFDFSGYSDVAIGLGRLYGIALPENFNRPYLQRNIQQFWQRWHITLSTWFRVYFFTPLSRTLIRSRYKIPQWGIILICQMATMILIGLWHGMTLNFFLWGAWHGIGLFLHKMLADNTRQWTKRVNAQTWSRRLSYGLSVFVTFHFVAIGWVFFALPHPQDSLTMIQRLFGGV